MELEEVRVDWEPKGGGCGVICLGSCFITLKTVFLAALAPDPDQEAASCYFALNCVVCFTGTLLADMVLVVLVIAVWVTLELAPAVGGKINLMFKKYLEKIFVAHLPLM